MENSSVRAENSDKTYESKQWIRAKLTEKFTKLLNEAHYGKLKAKIQNYTIDREDLTSEQLKNIKKAFTSERLIVGSVIRSLARELFGVERLTTTIPLTEYEETKLKDVLQMLDPHFFNDSIVYRLMVKNKINSYRCELRNKRPNSGPAREEGLISEAVENEERPVAATCSSSPFQSLLSMLVLCVILILVFVMVAFFKPTLTALYWDQRGTWLSKFIWLLIAKDLMGKKNPNTKYI